MIIECMIPILLFSTILYRVFCLRPKRRMFIGYYDGKKIRFDRKIDKSFRGHDEWNLEKVYCLHITGHNMWFKGTLTRFLGSWEFEEIGRWHMDEELKDSKNEKFVDYYLSMKEKKK